MYYVVFARQRKDGSRVATIVRAKTAQRRDFVMSRAKSLGETSADYLVAFTSTLRDAKEFCADLFEDGNNPVPSLI